MKQIIRLTESDLHKLIKESVKTIISEMDTTPVENDIITDAMDALSAMGSFDAEEGHNNIELDGKQIHMM